MSINYIEVIVRALILRTNKILLCRRVDRDYWFLPGGHVEWGESAQYALARELKEELDVAFKKFTFIGATENFFEGHQEVNFVFLASGGNPAETSVEKHLEFRFVSRKDFSKMNVVPQFLKKSILKWLLTKTPFWTSEGFGLS